MIDYLEPTAKAIREIINSDEETNLVSVLYNSKATKYKYELRTVLFYEIKDYSMKVNSEFDIDKFLEECNIEYFTKAKEACSTAFEFIVNCSVNTGVKIVCNIPEID